MWLLKEGATALPHNPRKTANHLMPEPGSRPVPVGPMNTFVQIYFHAVCALRRPAHWRWHLAGVRRALAA